ncbi:MAG: recombinase family protein [Pseudomonadota bacterium]
MTVRIRCAIYTRKSSEEGLEQGFNSLDAQREACAAFIASQRAEGWRLLPTRYDDGGLSGGTLERPALQALLEEVAAGRVDRIVVYKIDRLTRSLADFARIVDRLEGAGASFVSVTQSFNTATSMGRLTLNMLLSFAQFEREVTAERIRDKIAASKRKGLWMGGAVPIGYRPKGRSLAITEPDAALIRDIYDLYRNLGSARAVADALAAQERRTPIRIAATGRETGGNSINAAHIHRLLTNPVYAGRIRHRDQVYPGQHRPIIPPADCEAVQTQLQTSAAKVRGPSSLRAPAPLMGKLRDETGDPLTPTHATKAGRRLHYYISRRLVTGPARDHPTAWRLSAPILETAVANAIRGHLGDPTVRTALLPAADAAELTTLEAHLQKTIAAAATCDVTIALLATGTITPTHLQLTLDAEALAKQLGHSARNLDPAALTFETAIALRRRGQETRLRIGPGSPELDRTLLRNIKRARHWYARLKAGTPLGEIARAGGLPRSRVQHLLDLAFLAPDLLDAITRGTQPTGLTTEWIKRHSLPADWTAQRWIPASL